MSAKKSIGCRSEHVRAHAASRLELSRHWLWKESSLSGYKCESVPRCLRQVTAAAGHHSTEVLVAPLDLSSWRSFRAQLIGTGADSREPCTNQSSGTSRSWCHRISGAEQGCLLLSNTPGMGFFERAVVLVVEHTSTRSLGLMLNKQAGVQIQDLAIEGSITQADNQAS